MGRIRTYRQKLTLVVWIALTLLIVSWLYPPWVATHSYPCYHHDGFYFLFDPWNSGMRIDWMRLVVLDLVIVAITGGAVFTLRQNRKGD